MSAFPGTTYPEPHGILLPRVSLPTKPPDVRAGVPTLHTPYDASAEYSAFVPLYVTTDAFTEAGVPRGTTILLSAVETERYPPSHYAGRVVCVTIDDRPYVAQIEQVGPLTTARICGTEHEVPCSIVEIIGAVDMIVSCAEARPVAYKVEL